MENVVAMIKLSGKSDYMPFWHKYTAKSALHPQLGNGFSHFPSKKMDEKHFWGEPLTGFWWSMVALTPSRGMIPSQSCYFPLCRANFLLYWDSSYDEFNLEMMISVDAFIKPYSVFIPPGLKRGQNKCVQVVKYGLPTELGLVVRAHKRKLAFSDQIL